MSRLRRVVPRGSSVTENSENGWQRRVAGAAGVRFFAVSVALLAAFLVAPAGASHVSLAIYGTVAVGDGPGGIAVNPTTNKIYVANQWAYTVSVIDGATQTVTATIPVGARPVAVAVNPATNRIYVANKFGNSVSVIDGYTDAVIATIGVGGLPADLAVNSTTNRIYVANRSSETVSVLSGVTNTTIFTIGLEPGMEPDEIAVNESTNQIYVGWGYITLIDGSANAVVVSVPAGGNDIAVNPDTNRVYDGKQIFDGTTLATLGSMATYGRKLTIDTAENIIYTSGATAIDGDMNAVIGDADVVGSGLAFNEANQVLYISVEGADEVTFLGREMDDDYVPDQNDNCPSTPNQDQADFDGDGLGDACDDDIDNDGVSNATDNCPLNLNPSQGNVVHPTTAAGDECDDPDEDAVFDSVDNCPDVANSAQTDTDGDSAGDVCDLDDDDDGIPDSGDNCSVVANSDQQNSDADSWGDVCDNCPITDNEEQLDFDTDAMGDLCDGDMDADGLQNDVDPDADADGVATSAEGPCGADPFNHWKEPEKIWWATTDEDGDGIDNEPLPPGAGAYDCDGDGYTGDVEAYVFDYWEPGPLGGKFDQDACGYLGWPSETYGGVYGDYRVTVLDITHYLAPYRSLNTNVQPGGHRMDLVPGKGLFQYDINIADLTALISGPTGYPPMFGFSRAFNGPTCLSVQ